MSLDTTPPLIEPTNALTDPATHTVALVKPSQLGGTEMCINCLLWTLVNDPGPAMVIQPTLEMAGAFSKDRLTPAIRDCELVRNLVGTPRTRDADNSILRKGVPGAVVTISGANSPASLASRPIGSRGRTRSTSGPPVSALRAIPSRCSSGGRPPSADARRTW